MNRRLELVELARRLHAASAAGDWAALKVIDGQVAKVLPSVAELGLGNAQEQAAWAGLRQAHAQAHERCDREKARMSERLGTLRTNKEGWLAYAMQDSRQEVTS